MNHLIEASSTEAMSSIDLRDMVNDARAAHGESKVRNDDFLKRIEDELEGELGVCEIFAHPQSGVKMRYYLLSEDQCALVAMRESKSVRRSVLARLKELKSRQHVTIPQSLPDALRLAADLAEKNEVLQIANQQQSEKITSLESLFKEGMTVTQFCKGLNGVNVMAVNEYLLRRNWLYNESTTSTRWRAASYARDRYLTEHQSEITPHGQDPFIKFTPVLLKRGAVRLHELYLAGELPMKKSWDGQFTHDKESRRAA